MVELLSPEYPIALLCKVLGYSRSRYYYQPKHQHLDEELKPIIVEISGHYPTYGYRRMTAQLHRQGYRVNHKRVSRLMRELGISIPVRKKRKRTTNSVHSYGRYPNRVKELVVQHPEQVWVADITYIRLREEFVYLAVVMDVFSRSIRGWQLSRHLDQMLTLGALEKALAANVPQIHHSDQGVQYAATAYVEMLKTHGVDISMAGVGKAYENGYAERLMRTIKEEEVDLSDYRNYAEVHDHIKRFLEEVYMKKRIHSSLGYLTPVEFEEKWIQQQK